MQFRVARNLQKYVETVGVQRKAGSVNDIFPQNSYSYKQIKTSGVDGIFHLKNR